MSAHALLTTWHLILGRNLTWSPSHGPKPIGQSFCPLSVPSFTPRLSPSVFLFLLLLGIHIWVLWLNSKAAQSGPIASVVHTNALRDWLDSLMDDGTLAGKPFSFSLQLESLPIAARPWCCKYSPGMHLVSVTYFTFLFFWLNWCGMHGLFQRRGGCKPTLWLVLTSHGLLTCYVTDTS
jgi:hypothetical protein